MKKIKTVFKIERDGARLATEEVQTPWVLEGEGIATVKHDGTSCMIRGGKLFKRFDAKKSKTPPAGFEPCEAAPDPVTGHWPGWVPVDPNNPGDRWHIEAFKGDEPDGTFELIGPKVQKNPHGLTEHVLVKHGSVVVEVERTREGIIRWLEDNLQEGLVFHHPDGRMAKARRKDFGLKW